MSKCDLYHPDGSGRVVDAAGERGIMDPDLPILWLDYSVLTLAQSEACWATMLALRDELNLCLVCSAPHSCDCDEPADGGADCYDPPFWGDT